MYIAIDIGGTNTRVGASRDGREFFGIETFKTPKRFEDGVCAIVAHIQRFGLLAVLRGGRTARHPKIAIAVPGPVDRRGNVLHVPNLPGWRGKLSARALSRIFHTHIVLVNDANTGGLGEAVRGAGRGYDIVAYLTLSTGIGGARIHQRVIDGAAQGFEPGQQILVPGGRRCGCGQRGCFEAYGSGTGFYKTYGIRPEKCKNKKIWAKHAQTVGWGLINTIVHWSPDVVVIGGGLSQVGSMLFTPLRSYVRKNLKILKTPPIVPAKLGDNAGLFGCLKLLR